MSSRGISAIYNSGLTSGGGRGISAIYNGGLTSGSGQSGAGLGDLVNKGKEYLKQKKLVTKALAFADKHGITDKLKTNALGMKVLEGAEYLKRSGYGKKRKSPKRKRSSK